MPGALNRPARHAGTPLPFLTFTQIGSLLTNSWNSRPVFLLVLLFVLISAADVRRTSFRSFSETLDMHEILIRACWLRTSMARGTLVYNEVRAFVTDSSLAENFHVFPLHQCAVLLNKDTFARDFSCTPVQGLCSLRYSSWAVEGIVVTSTFSRAPDQSCSHFTVANVQINNECAKRIFSRRVVWCSLLWQMRTGLVSRSARR